MCLGKDVKMEIFIDGDGCPVVDLTIKIAQKNSIAPVTCSGDYLSDLFGAYNWIVKYEPT